MTTKEQILTDTLRAIVSTCSMKLEFMHGMMSGAEHTHRMSLEYIRSLALKGLETKPDEV